MDARSPVPVDLIRAGRFAQAETECRALLSERPDHALAWNLLGIALDHVSP